MTADFAAGLACGLMTAAISEALLRRGGAWLRRSLFRALAAGALLRAVWVLGLLAWAAFSGAPEPRAFVPALMLGYLAAQVFEGVRYTRYFERC